MFFIPVKFRVTPPMSIFWAVSIFGVEAFMILYTSKGAKPSSGRLTLQEPGLGVQGPFVVGAAVGMAVFAAACTPFAIFAVAWGSSVLTAESAFTSQSKVIVD